MADVQIRDSEGIEAREVRIADKDALVARLDELLERYLYTLDEYQKLGEQLSKNLSAGYFSLAQANFQNRSTATRYGQDCYDERMQAVRRITLSADQDDIVEAQIHFSTTSSLNKTPGSPTPASAEQEKEEESSQPIPDTTSSSEPLNSDSNPVPDAEPNDDDQTASDTNPPKDPIRMFGILVPQALRDAQASFVAAVDGPVPRLAMAARDLRTQEIEIGRVRKQIKKL